MAFRNESYVPVLDTQGKQTNPTTATVLADTGELSAGMYEVRVTVGCSAAATMNVEHRNAANGGNVTDVVLLRVAAGQTGMYVFKYAVNVNERFRVVPEANITGDAEASIQAIKTL
jgi:hypothetical protein